VCKNLDGRGLAAGHSTGISTNEGESIPGVAIVSEAAAMGDHAVHRACRRRKHNAHIAGRFGRHRVHASACCCGASPDKCPIWGVRPSLTWGTQPANGSISSPTSCCRCMFAGRGSPRRRPETAETGPRTGDVVRIWEPMFRLAGRRRRIPTVRSCATKRGVGRDATGCPDRRTMPR
jgi:hypothetical protein